MAIKERLANEWEDEWMAKLSANAAKDYLAHEAEEYKKFKENRKYRELIIPWPEDEFIGTEFEIASGEVIRCKDCQFHDAGENEVDAWNRCCLHHVNTNNEAYCSWAIKRSSNA